MLKFLCILTGLFIVNGILSLAHYTMIFSFCVVLWIGAATSTLSASSYFLLDNLSWFLILLSFWIVLLMVISSSSYFTLNFYPGKFTLVLTGMMLLLFLTFSVSDLLSFYIFFEGSLIPIYMLIVGWGYQPERLQAGIYLFLYTIFASLPLMASLFLIKQGWGSFSLEVLGFGVTPGASGLLSFWFFFSIFAFLVKLPVFYFHLWLPKAHVEAPVSGSMMLAGVLLKLGCYGLMRLMPFFQSASPMLTSLLISLGLVGGLFVGLICLRQVDLKCLIAYSSVSHMGLLLGGLLSWGFWGFSSSLYMCVAHGLCSSGLFFLSGVIYERSGSRSFSINKGLVSIMPSTSFWWFLFCVGNLGAPVVLNLFGELGLLGSLLSFSFYTMILLMFFSFLGACYSLFLFSNTQHGEYFSGVQSFGDSLIREHLILFLHFIPLTLLILETDLMTL